MEAYIEYPVAATRFLAEQILSFSPAAKKSRNRKIRPGLSYSVAQQLQSSLVVQKNYQITFAAIAPYP